MRVKTLIEFLDAAANTNLVSGPFDERGGIILVGPPGILKTTMIETVMSNHPDSLSLSDLNVQQWLKIKDEFVSNRYSTLAFGEFEKIYQRHPATAANLEGIIKALVSEGYGTGPGGDPRMPQIKARALVIGGITTDCFERKYNEWQKNGFIRRFIWIVLAIQNPDAIMKAIRRWEKIDFGNVSLIRPANRTIKVNITEEKSKYLEKIMRTQPGLHGTGYVLMKKILAVLEWKNSENGHKGDRTLELLDEIAPSLSKEGDKIVLGK